MNQPAGQPVLFTYFCSQNYFMDTSRLLIIIFFSSFTGWFVSWLIIKILFWPAKPLRVAGFNIQGVIPSKQEYFSKMIAEKIQAAFLSYKGLEEKAADPSLLEKLKPEIEIHIDHFLKEKLKSVFPILAQFMGEKTINQFKAAFLTEIDNLLPVLIKNYMGQLKNEIRLDIIISEKINMLSMPVLKEIFYSNTVKERRYLVMASTAIGTLTGIITCLILLFLA